MTACVSTSIQRKKVPSEMLVVGEISINDCRPFKIKKFIKVKLN